MFTIKNLARILLDLSLVALAFVIATAIRLEGNVVSAAEKFIWQEQLLQILPVVVLVKFVILVGFKTYQRFWRYTSIKDLIHLSRSLSVSLLVMLLPRALGQNPNANDILAISYGIGIIDFFVSLALLSAPRLFRHYQAEQVHIKQRLRNVDINAKKALLIGAGEAGVQMLQTLERHPELGIRAVAVLDDDTKKHGMFLGKSIPVKGATADMKFWAAELGCDEIIICIPSLSAAARRKINQQANETGLVVKTIPGTEQLAGGQVTVEQIRKLSMEDLLGRDEIDLAVPEVLAYLKGKRVLVTGAGGSIGRELCKQLYTKCKIEAICLLGKGENSIFQTMIDLQELNLDIPVEKKIADIKNEERIDAIITEFEPDVIFHAAAHKHVHLMECNPCEAFDNNVLGTLNMAKLAGQKGVGTFVLISTDKSVHPTSIMGSTKQLAERTVLSCKEQYPETKYTVVRFGNVLGSRGSVIRVWEQQLKNSKAITVTHKEAVRYFMTIPEASQLVIQASAKAQSGEVMVLDMGEEIKVYDLAKQFIQLSGFDPSDYPIEIIGLKPGEKLYEELLTSEEFIENKLTDKIYRARITRGIDKEKSTQDLVTELSAIARSNNNEPMASAIRANVS